MTTEALQHRTSNIISCKFEQTGHRAARSSFQCVHVWPDFGIARFCESPFGPFHTSEQASDMAATRMSYTELPSTYHSMNLQVTRETIRCLKSTPRTHAALQPELPADKLSDNHKDGNDRCAETSRIRIKNILFFLSEIYLVQVKPLSEISPSVIIQKL